jgi:hypothetical protein
MMNLETALFLINGFPKSAIMIEGIYFKLAGLLSINNREKIYSYASSDNVTIIFKSHGTEMKFYDLTIFRNNSEVLKIDSYLKDEQLAMPISKWVY